MSILTVVLMSVVAVGLIALAITFGERADTYYKYIHDYSYSKSNKLGVNRKGLRHNTFLCVLFAVIVTMNVGSCIYHWPDSEDSSYDLGKMMNKNMLKTAKETKLPGKNRCVWDEWE